VNANRLNAFVLGDAGGVVYDRAAALVGALTPVLVWVRDYKGVPLNIGTVRLSFELRSIWKVVTQRMFEVRDPVSGETTEIPVPETPEDVVYLLQAYLGGLPSYDMKQHGLAKFYFTDTFPLLGPRMDRAE
jgi:intracellular multiplication protein IcmO